MKYVQPFWSMTCVYFEPNCTVLVETHLLSSRTWVQKGFKSHNDQTVLLPVSLSVAISFLSFDSLVLAEALPSSSSSQCPLASVLSSAQRRAWRMRCSRRSTGPAWTNALTPPSVVHRSDCIHESAQRDNDRNRNPPLPFGGRFKGGDRGRTRFPPFVNISLQDPSALIRTQIEQINSEYDKENDETISENGSPHSYKNQSKMKTFDKTTKKSK
eukprot:3673870-Amphidinium_carterae.1